MGCLGVGCKRGFSFIEALISCMLASMIILILASHYHLLKRQSLHLEKQLLQETDLQTLIEEIRHSIYHAGFTPCMRMDQIRFINTHRDSRLSHPIQLDVSQPSKLDIKRMSETFAVVTHQVSASQILVDQAIFQPGEQVLVSDCFHGEVHTIREVHTSHDAQSVIFYTPLRFHYLSTAFVGAWIEERYQIKTDKKGQNVLYYCNPKCEALSEAIEHLTWQTDQFKKGLLIRGEFGLKDGTTKIIQASLRN